MKPSNKCSSCQRAHELVPGARCVAHQTNGSLSLTEMLKFNPEYEKPGVLGPVPVMICGWFKCRPVDLLKKAGRLPPVFDADGKRVHGVTEALYTRFQEQQTETA